MDNISKKDISFRLDKLKDKALKINENIQGLQYHKNNLFLQNSVNFFF